jgi:hypothetical protein
MLHVPRSHTTPHHLGFPLQPLPRLSRKARLPLISGFSLPGKLSIIVFDILCNTALVTSDPDFQWSILSFLFSPVALNPSAKILFYICFFAARRTFPQLTSFCWEQTA